MLVRSFAKELDHQRAGFAKMIGEEKVLRQLDNDAAFTDIVKTALGYGVKPSDLARSTKMSPATISRWASGQSAPHPLVRRAVVAEIQRLIEIL